MGDQEKHAVKEGHPPFALAMVVCDAIWRDPSTGKRTLLGCFSAILAREFPARCFLSVYVSLTDGHGKVPISLRLIDVDEAGPAVFELRGEGNFSDPRVILEVDFSMINSVFPTPGEYRLQLFAGSHPIMERRIVVARVGGTDDEPETESQHH